MTHLQERVQQYSEFEQSHTSVQVASNQTPGVSVIKICYSLVSVVHLFLKKKIVASSIRTALYQHSSLRTIELHNVRKCCQLIGISRCFFQKNLSKHWLFTITNLYISFSRNFHMQHFIHYSLFWTHIFSFFFLACQLEH